MSGRDRLQAKQFPPLWQEEPEEITKAGSAIANLFLCSFSGGWAWRGAHSLCEWAWGGALDTQGREAYFQSWPSL